MTVPILATKAARKQLDKLLKDRGIGEKTYYAFVHKLVTGEGLEPKGPGFYGFDLGLNSLRALFTFDKDNNPVFFFVGDHSGYTKYSNEISENMQGVKSKILNSTIEETVLADKNNKHNFTLVQVRENLRSHLRRLNLLGGKADVPRADTGSGDSGKPGKDRKSGNGRQNPGCSTHGVRPGSWSPYLRLHASWLANRWISMLIRLQLGGGLKRFRPDSQSGSQFLQMKDIVLCIRIRRLSCRGADRSFLTITCLIFNAKGYNLFINKDYWAFRTLPEMS